MKNKLIIDIFLFVLLVLTMEYAFTGNLIHEMIGIIFTFGIIIHLLKNRLWIKKSTLNFNKINKKSKFNYLLDILLFIIILLIFISSIMISKDIFAFLNITYKPIYYDIHKYTSYLLMIIILIHIISHLSIIFKFIINKFKIEDELTFKVVFIATLFILSLLSFRHLLNNNQEKSLNNTPNSNNEINKKPIEKDDKTSDNKNEDYIPENNNQDQEEDEKETLNDYLSKLRCNGCHRGCLLSSPRCGRGSYYQQQAIQEYNKTYNISMYQENDIIYSSNKKYILKI